MSEFNPKTSLGLYIHVPFCRSKCPYCDFYSVILGKNDRREQFANALCEEITSYKGKIDKNIVIDTIYFGGGTPNLLKSEQIEVVLKTIFASFGENLAKNAEITMEFNPKSSKNATKDEILQELKSFKAVGVNRVSIGMQSFSDVVLKKLGRLHSASDGAEFFGLARQAGFENISIDLMFGIPGQTEEMWQESVRKAVELGPEHISLYSLEFMEGTHFTKLLESGKMTETEPEFDRKMYHFAIAEFEKAGYMQYEISNVAKPGFESKHNTKYWEMKEYIGFGPAAHSYFEGKRYNNAESIDEYLEAPCGGKNYYENLTKEDEMSEFMFTGLRMAKGVKFADFKKRFGVEIFEAFKDAKAGLEDFEKAGFVIIDEESVKLTLKGFDISNKILCLFV